MKPLSNSIGSLAVVFSRHSHPLPPGRRKLRPAELIAVEGSNLEENINSFVSDTLVPSGFALQVPVCVCVCVCVCVTGE
jgi:predicted thioesterase